MAVRWELMFSAAPKFVAPWAIREIPNKKIDSIYFEAPKEKDCLFKCVCVQSNQSHDMEPQWRLCPVGPLE